MSNYPIEFLRDGDRSLTNHIAHVEATPMEEQPTVFVVEDARDVCDTVAGAVTDLGIAMQPFATAGDTLAFCKPDMPGCFVLGHRAGGTHGLHLHKQLEAKGCRQPFIFVPPAGDVAGAVEAMHEGALDCIEKPVNRQRLAARLQEAIAKDAELRHSRAQRAAVVARLDSLTPRERQVLDLVAAGRITKEVARHLEISPKTVEVHRSNIMKKLHVDSAAELLHLIAKFTLLPMSDDRAASNGYHGAHDRVAIGF
jgi:RNA polymerase sigma factor (sigma-70 family)